MLIPISKNFKGLVTISGPTRSGKSEFGEFLISKQEYITYIATSKQRPEDQEWQERINKHRNRRPEKWKLIEYTPDICLEIQSIEENEAILIDSLGGVVEQNIMSNNQEWELFQKSFVKTLLLKKHGIILISEEVGWGIVPPTPIGHLFRERLSILYYLISQHSTKRWLAVNGTAIDLDKIGYIIPRYK